MSLKTSFLKIKDKHEKKFNNPYKLFKLINPSLESKLWDSL
jgi:hypothetical protein